MTVTFGQQADGVAPGEPGQPVERVGRRWTGALTLANLGVWAAWYGPLQILLALQAEHLAPAHKTSTLALVNLLGAIVSVVANPLFGALSDRTTARAGRRLPWVVFGVLGGTVGLTVLAGASTVAVMAFGWCIVQFTLNAAYAALTAAVPDQVPSRQRGVVGGWLGVAQILGVLAGTALATVAGGVSAGYLACAVFSVLAVLPYLLMRRDIVLARADRPAFEWRAFLAGFWVDPRRFPDFGWAWLTRFLVNLSNAICTMYLLYYLTDAVHYRGDADTGVLVLTALDAVTLLATVVVGGMWSDRLGRRKVFVVWSGIIMSVATLMLAVWQTWTGAIVASLVLGVGFGVYTSVDFALLTDVLPAARSRGRDLGVINIAAALPQVIAPVLAAPVVDHLGGYTALYAVAGAIGIVGSLLVHRIRGVA